MVSIALCGQWVIEQWNVKAVFLYTELHHNVYIKDPLVTGDKVCKLNKSLYRLKQAAQEWNQEFSGHIQQAELNELVMDNAAFFGNNIRLATHVNDGLITGAIQQDIDQLAKQLETAGLILKRKRIPSKYLGLEYT